MAKATTRTLLSLDQYAELLGINPFHFNQIVCTAFPESRACDDIWFQYAWMRPDKASREDLARAVAQAEQQIAEFVGFWPAPKWTEQEHHLYPRQGRMADNRQLIYFPAFSSMRRKTIKTSWRHFIAGGRRSTAEIELDVLVDYEDLDGDGYDEWAVVDTSFPTVLDPGEIAVFAGDLTEPEEQIRGLEVQVDSNGDIRISGWSALFLDPELWRRSVAVDGDETTCFLERVNVHRVYNSEAGESFAPVQFGWQVEDETSIQAAYGVLQEWQLDPSIATPIPATWDEDTEQWEISSWDCRDLANEPHLARLWYLAGWSLDTRQRMREPFARAVAALATALLTKPICGCGFAEKLADYWQEIPATREGIWASFNQLDCPFGPQRGAWEAWNVCRRFSGFEGTSM